MRLRVDASSPIPIRRQLTEQVKHFIDAGTFPRNHALPSIRQLATELEVNPNTIARVVDDLKRDGYVLAHRGRGVFVAPNPPARPSPSLRDAFLKDVVIRGAALGKNADEVAVGVLSLARVRPAPLRRPATVLLVECSSEVLDFFANEIESHLPVHVDKVLLGELSAVVRRRKRGRRWAAAVTSFFHLREVERRVGDKRVPVIPLLASAHLATLHRLAQLPPGTRIAAGIITYFNADYEPADKSEALFARLRRPDGLVEIIALRPEAIEVDRADFHLQGQHDQQSHAGGDGSDAKPEKVAQRERIIELGKELGCDKLSFRRLPIDRRLDAPVIAQVKGDTLEVEFNEDYVTCPYSSSLTPERLREVLAHEGAHVQLSTALRAPGSKAAEFIGAQRKTEQILPPDQNVNHGHPERYPGLQGYPRGGRSRLLRSGTPDSFHRRVTGKLPHYRPESL